MVHSYGRHILLGSVSGLVLAATASGAAAQQSGTSVATVLEPITVISTKTPHTLDEVPANVTVIDSDAIESRAPGKIDDLLRDLPGVDMQGGPRRVGQDVNIRGFGGQRVVVTLDGARQNFAAGHKGRFFVEPDLLREVEVLRGSASALHGSGAIGGVVAMETKDAADYLDPGKTYGFSTKLGYSSVAREPLFSQTLFGRPDERLDLLANFSYRDGGTLQQGGGRELPYSAERMRNGFFKGTLRPAENHSVSLSVTRFIQDGIHPTNPDEEPNLGSQARNPIVDRETEMTTMSLTYRYDNPATPLFSPTLKLYRNDLSVTEDRQIIADGDSARLDQTDLETWGFDLYNTARFQTGALGHALTFGVEHYTDEQTGSRNGAARSTYPNGKAMVTGLYLQDEIALTDTLTLTPAVRYDRYENESSAAADADDSRVSPSLAASWQAQDWATLFGSYSYGFRAPNPTEMYVSGTHFAFNQFIPNPDLRPEKTKTAELGFKLKFDDVVSPRDQMRFNATYFHTKAEDFIETRVTVADAIVAFPPFVIPGAGGTSTNVNLPRAEIDGVELEWRYDSPFAFAGAAYSRIRGENKETGLPVDSIPADKLVTYVGAKLPQYDLRFGVKSEFAAEQHRVSGVNDNPTEGGTPPTDGYAVHGLFVTWMPSHQWLQGFRVDAGVENIFDQTYRRHLQTLYEEGRDFRLAVSYTASF